MRTFTFTILLFTFLFNINLYSQNVLIDYGFVDLDMVSVAGYYDNYTTNYYLYTKKSESTDQSGRKLIDCGATPFNFNFNFQVVKNRHSKGGVGLLSNFTDNLSDILIYPGTLILENLDNKSTPDIPEEKLATTGGLVKPNSTASINIKLIDMPNPGYDELALLTWGDDPYKYNLKASFDILEFATGKVKTLHFFDQPYNIIGCDRECYPFYCAASGLYLGSYMIAEVSDIVPDKIDAYRDETGGQDAITTIKITYKKIDNDVFDALERAMEEWVLKPQSSKLQQLRNLVAAPFTAISELFCQGNADNESYGGCFKMPVSPLCEKEEHPNIIDYIFCGVKSPLILPTYQLSTFLTSIANVTADYLTNPDMSLPLKLLQLMSIGWPVFGFKVDYIKVEYEPEKDAPTLPPLIYNVSEKYGRTYAYLRTPNLSEWISNKPVEKTIDLKVVDGKVIEKYFKDYHLKSFDYKMKLSIYLSGDYPSKAKMIRNGKVYINLDD